MLINENPLLAEEAALNKCYKVMDLICEKCMKQRDMNEVLAMKMHYISCIFQKCINSHRFQMYYSSKRLKIFTFLKNLFTYYVFIGLHQVFVGAHGIFAALCRIFWVAGWTLVVALRLGSCGMEIQLPLGIWGFSSPISNWAWIPLHCKVDS